MKIDWWDVVSWVAMVMVIGSVIVAVQVYYNIGLRECTSDPLVYASKFYEEKYGLPFSGSGSFAMEGSSPIIYFSSGGLKVQQTDNRYLRIDLDNLVVINETDYGIP